MVRKTVCTLCSPSSQSNTEKNRHTLHEERAMHFDLHRRKQIAWADVLLYLLPLVEPRNCFFFF